MKNRDIKILIVDDDLMSLESLRSFLSSEGYNIEAHSEIESAWKACERKNFEIVASDYMLKDADGLDFLHRVKLMNPQTYTILFTGFSDNDILNRLESCNVDLFLTKPLIVNNLIELFEEIRNKKKLAES